MQYTTKVIWCEVLITIFKTSVHTQQSKHATDHQVFNIMMTKPCPSVKMHCQHTVACQSVSASSDMDNDVPEGGAELSSETGPTHRHHLIAMTRTAHKSHFYRLHLLPVNGSDVYAHDILQAFIM